MNSLFVLEGRPGETRWYGWRSDELRHVFKKNLFFFEKAYDVKAHHLKISAHKFQLVLEGNPNQIHKLSEHFIQRMNQQLQHGSEGINVFSGGLALNQIPF